MQTDAPDEIMFANFARTPVAAVFAVLWLNASRLSASRLAPELGTSDTIAVKTSANLSLGSSFRQYESTSANVDSNPRD